MIIEFIPAEGVGRGRPVVLEVTQVVIRQDNGTPIGIALKFGPEGADAIALSEKISGAIAGDGDFERLLQAAGIHDVVICDRLQIPKPHPGAVLVADPRKRMRHGS